MAPGKKAEHDKLSILIHPKVRVLPDGRIVIQVRRAALPLYPSGEAAAVLAWIYGKGCSKSILRLREEALLLALAFESRTYEPCLPGDSSDSGA